MIGRRDGACKPHPHGKGIPRGHELGAGISAWNWGPSVRKQCGMRSIIFVFRLCWSVWMMFPRSGLHDAARRRSCHACLHGVAYREPALTSGLQPLGRSTGCEWMAAQMSCCFVVSGISEPVDYCSGTRAPGITEIIAKLHLFLALTHRHHLRPQFSVVRVGRASGPSVLSKACCQIMRECCSQSMLM